jgi:hypothetical protein
MAGEKKTTPHVLAIYDADKRLLIYTPIENGAVEDSITHTGIADSFAILNADHEVITEGLVARHDDKTRKNATFLVDSVNLVRGFVFEAKIALKRKTDAR